MKLNKTETKIMKEIEKDRRKTIHISMTYGHGPEGGWFSYGARKYKAGLKLIDKGFLECIDHSGYGHSSGGGYSHRDNTMVLRLIPPDERTGKPKHCKR